jgi:ribosome-associated protein
MEAGHRPRSKRVDEGSAWISVDFLDVVVHVFTDEARDYYRLESLWRSAPRSTWKGSPATPRATLTPQDAVHIL